MRAIMHRTIGYNIIDIVNQHSFAYHDIMPELRVFVLLSIEWTQMADFIYALKKK